MLIFCTFVQNVRSLGSQVRARRRELGLRQQDLADLAGCSTRFLHELEHDKPRLALDLVLEVLRVLGLTLVVAPIEPEHAVAGAK